MVEIVAEFTTNHFGHMGLLRRMVDAAKAAGADTVKMQAKDVESFYTQEKLDASFNSPFGKTFREYRTAFELSEEDEAQFATYCEARIRWFETVQDATSLAWCIETHPYGLWRIKLASSNARNWPLLRTVADEWDDDCEIVLSLAGSSLGEIERALNIIDNGKRQVWLLHCVAEYPCPVERLRLGNIRVLQQHFASANVHIGYSGHEIGYMPTIAAVNLGAEMVERHFCVSRHSFVHHIECSLEPQEFRKMVDDIHGGLDILDQIKPEALTVDFGMSEQEKAFLVHQTYGRDYLGKDSRFGDD